MIVPLLASCGVNYPVLLRHLKHSNFGVCDGKAGVINFAFYTITLVSGGTPYVPAQNESDLFQHFGGASASIIMVQMTSVNLQVYLSSSDHKRFLHLRTICLNFQGKTDKPTFWSKWLPFFFREQLT